MTVVDERLKREIQGYHWYYNDEAFRLAKWALDEYKSDNKDRYLTIKSIADRMEGKFRDYFGHNMRALPAR